MKKIFSLFLGVLATISCHAQKNGYRILSTFHIPSTGKWDYIAINPVTDNIYVSHATQVNILNKQGDSVGVINNTTGVHGIAFAPQFGKGFTSNGKLNTVTVFDIKTNQVLAQINTGENPDAIMYDPFSKMVYTCDGHSKDLTVIDPSNNQVLHTIALGGKPETAVSNGTGKIYINIEDKNEIVVLNASTYVIEAHWPLGKGEEPSGLAIDNKNHRLFAGCSNKLLAVINATNGKVIENIPIGDGCDGVAFDADLKQVYSSNGEGTLTIIKELSPDKYSVIQNAHTKRGAKTLVVDPKDHLIYLPTAEFQPQNDDDKKNHKRPEMIPGTFQVLVVGK